MVSLTRFASNKTAELLLPATRTTAYGFPSTLFTSFHPCPNIEPELSGLYGLLRKTFVLLISLGFILICPETLGINSWYTLHSCELRSSIFYYYPYYVDNTRIKVYHI